jgi:hypothetical protein
MADLGDQASSLLGLKSGVDQQIGLLLEAILTSQTNFIYFRRKV